ncbi:MAG: hypothetical protein J7498_09875 [Sphingobium sp.]|nr:hypothetical protein [Sphingobium sp.]
MRHGWVLLAAGAAISPVQPLFAQAEDAQGRIVFDAAYFRAYSPTNALQMIQRVPGFALDAGNAEVRGFGQAAGNVVINGQRPSSKSDDLSSVLARIPASRILRIELASGNAFGSDYAGNPQVANVVLTDAGGLAGTLEGRIDREYTGRLLPTAAASFVLRTGASTFNASLSYQLKANDSNEGFDRITGQPSGNLIEYSYKARRQSEPYHTLALGWALEEAADRNIHVNGRLIVDAWRVHQTYDVQPVAAPRHDDLYQEHHLWYPFELSGDVTRPLGGGAIKLNLLATHRYRKNLDTLTQRISGQLQGGSYKAQYDWRDERIARLAWSRRDLGGWSVEIGAEGAFNRLESDLNLFEIDANEHYAQIDLPIDDAVVTEYRVETFVNAGRFIVPALRLDLGLKYEASRLKVAGDASVRRSLRFLKPKASVDWSGGGWHAQFSAERTVAQLDFTDFVSGASFTANQFDGGNADLLPQRAWELLLSADRAILGAGRIKAELGYNRIFQVQDRVPTPGGFDAPGNLGSGRQWIGRLNVDLPLARFGIKGGRLSFKGTYLDSKVQDPYTGLDRPFSGEKMFVFSSEFRQDLGRFAWGLQTEGNSGATTYRRTETDNNNPASVTIGMFTEYRPHPRSTITFGITNIGNLPTKRWRYFYSPDRSSLHPVRQEYRERSMHRRVYLSIKHSFG